MRTTNFPRFLVRFAISWFVISSIFPGSLLAGVSDHAGKLLITEISCKDGENDWVEVYVVDASVDWSGYRLKVGGVYKCTIPDGWALQEGDYIVFHEEAGTDDVTKSDNNPWCWDIYGMGDLAGTDRILQIVEPSGSAKRVDCVIYSNANGVFTSSVTEANGAVADGMWGDYDFSVGDEGAWTDTDELEANQTIARYMTPSRAGYVDQNSHADWYICANPSMGSLNDQSLSVFVTSIQAVPQMDGILFCWETQSETGCLGFRIYRGEGSSELLQPVSPLIPGQGNSPGPRQYTFLDRSVIEGKRYRYQLVDVDWSGRETRHPVLAIYYERPDSPCLPGGFSLEAPYPNPFRPGRSAEGLTFTLRIAEAVQVEIAIVNLLGQRVRLLYRGKLSPGVRLFRWDGTDDSGRLLSAGLYFWVVTSPERQKSERILLFR